MSDTIVTIFCYDWCNRQNGIAYCETPFYLGGYGPINDSKELDEILSAFRLIEVINLRQAILWKELSVHEFEEVKNLMDKDIVAFFSDKGQLTVVPTMIQSRSGNHIWLFIINDEKVIGIMK